MKNLILAMAMVFALGACNLNDGGFIFSAKDMGITIPTNDLKPKGESALKAAALPVEVTVRFANPVYSAIDQTLKVEAQFKSDQPGQQLFGMNVRFWFDSSVLKFMQFVNFKGGYQPMIPNPPYIAQAVLSARTLWGFQGAPIFVNGAVILTNKINPIYLDTWVTLFSVKFKVNNPVQGDFCPPLVWDLKANPAEGGYLRGCAGVVITIVNTFDPNMDSWYSNEKCAQFNWMYNNPSVMPCYGVATGSSCVSIL